MSVLENTTRRVLVPVRSTSSTSTSGNYAQEMLLRKVEDLSAQYHDCLGIPMPRYIKDSLIAALERGENSIGTYMTYALREASRAPRPSWAYARAIIQRLKREGVTIDELFTLMDADPF